MVGPSITDDYQATGMRRLAAGFVLLLGFTGGMIAVRGDAPMAVVALAAAAGGAVGVGLLVYLSSIVR